MLRAGLTGGIASGKTTVSRTLSRLGIPVFDADEIAREAVAPGTEGLAAVVEAFGPEVLAPGGELDRKRLGELVFADAAKRSRLEEILHPRIMAEQDRLLDEAEAAGESSVAVVDAALMIESGGWRRFDRVVVVDCGESLQIERLMRRDGIGEADARARLRAQIPLSEKVKLADKVIDSRGSLEETEAQVEALADWLREEAKKKAEKGIDKGSR
ncbi:MAG: dephospho-CoA kinase [bacterium]